MWDKFFYTVSNTRRSFLQLYFLSHGMTNFLYFFGFFSYVAMGITSTPVLLFWICQDSRKKGAKIGERICL